MIAPLALSCLLRCEITCIEYCSVQFPDDKPTKQRCTSSRWTNLIIFSHAIRWWASNFKGYVFLSAVTSHVSIDVTEWNDIFTLLVLARYDMEDNMTEILSKFSKYFLNFSRRLRKVLKQNLTICWSGNLAADVREWYHYVSVMFEWHYGACVITPVVVKLSWRMLLNHYCLAASCGDLNLSQHWLR